MGELTGLLLVHGIGTQARASVLTASCDALVSWLRHRYGPDQVRYGTTTLGLGVDNPDEPPSVRVELPGDVTWLVAESRWADSFVQPTYARIVPWTLGAVVRTVAHEVGLLLGPNKQQVGPDDGVSLLAPARPVRTNTAVRHAKAALLLATLPLALLGIASTSALRFVPPLRPTADRIQSVLSATIGDSFVFVAGLTGHNAVVLQVRRDIEWMQAQGVTRLVIAAHSQGAAVTYAALARCRCSRGDETGAHCGSKGQQVDLITYGSGLAKLTAISPHRGHRVGLRDAVGLVLAGVAGALGLILLGAATIVALVTLQESVPHLGLTIAGSSLALVVVVASAWTLAIFFRFWAWKWAPLTAFGTLVLMLLGVVAVVAVVSPAPALGGLGLLAVTYAVAMVWFRGPPFDESHPRPPMVRQWIDVRSTSDPVASSSTSGSLDRIDLTVHNLRSVAFDHTSYWSNWSEFLPIVVNALAGQRTSLHVPRFWTIRERSRRHEWTWVLAGARVLVVLACISVLVAALTSLRAVGAGAIALYADVVDAIPGADLESSDVSPTGERILGMVVVIVVFAIVYRTSAGAWHWWQNLSEERQVGELLKLQALHTEWPTWRSAVRCTRAGGTGDPEGWLVLRATCIPPDGPSELVWFEGDSPGENTSREVSTEFTLRPRWPFMLSLGDPKTGVRYLSRSIRSVAHLDRVNADPQHR